MNEIFQFGHEILLPLYETKIISIVTKPPLSSQRLWVMLVFCKIVLFYKRSFYLPDKS